MKVLMVSTDELIIREGSEAYFRMREYGNLFSELHIILFSKEKERNPGEIQDKFHGVNLGGIKSNSTGQKKIRENVFVYPVFSICRFFIPFKAFSKVKKIIKGEKKEWVTTTQDLFETGLVGFLLKVFYKIGWQVQVHTDFLSPFFFRQSFLNKIRVVISKIIIWKADRVRVVSERIKKSLIEIGFKGEKIDVLPIAVQAEEIKNMPITFDLRKEFPDANFIIFMASRLTPEKNIKLALNAFSEALKINSGMKLVIAGDGPCKKDLEDEAEKRGIFQDVKFLGKLSYQEVISGMKTADLFLSSSVYEGYGMAVVEAAAVGCPVLMTDTGVAGEIIKDGENGTVVPVGLVSKMAEAIVDLAGDNNKRKKIAEEGKKIVLDLISKEEYLKKFREIMELVNKK